MRPLASFLVLSSSTRFVSYSLRGGPGFLSSRARTEIRFLQQNKRHYIPLKTHSDVTMPTTANDNCKENLTFYQLDEPIGSTQDETKRLLSLAAKQTKDNHKMTTALAVLADQQTNGRGTNGRTWEGNKGNVHLTIAVPREQIPVTITLLPLQVGVLIANTLMDLLSASATATDTSAPETPPKPTVKWPNDVLLDNRKVAGVLIENWISPSDPNACWFLIGIGINVLNAPTNLPSGVRPATCIQEFSSEILPKNTAKELGKTLTHSFIDWIMKKSADETNVRGCNNGQSSIIESKVIADWKSLAKFGDVYTIRETGEQVTTIDIEPDGQLRVQGVDGKQRLLVSDYLH